VLLADFSYEVLDPILVQELARIGKGVDMKGLHDIVTVLIDDITLLSSPLGSIYNIISWPLQGLYPETVRDVITIHVLGHELQATSQ